MDINQLLPTQDIRTGSYTFLHFLHGSFTVFKKLLNVNGVLLRRGRFFSFLASS